MGIAAEAEGPTRACPSALFLERSAITCGPAGVIFADQLTDIRSSSLLFEPAQLVQTRTATTRAETRNSLLRKVRLPPHDTTDELPIFFNLLCFGLFALDKRKAQRNQRRMAKKCCTWRRGRARRPARGQRGGGGG